MLEHLIFIIYTPVVVSNKITPSELVIFFISFYFILASQVLQDLHQMREDTGKRSSETADFVSDLEKNAFHKGFLVSDNRGEGDCMFYALSEQLEFVQGFQYSAKELRKELVEYLRQHPKLVNKLYSCYMYFEVKFTIQAFFKPFYSEVNFHSTLLYSSNFQELKNILKTARLDKQLGELIIHL